MRPSRTTLAAPAAALVAVLGLAAPAAAGAVRPPAPVRGVLQVGLSEQNDTVFRDPTFRRLGLRYARLVVPWDLALGPARRRIEVHRWVDRAVISGIEPHVAFGGTSFSRRNRNRVPSLSRYRTAVVHFRRQFPSVRVFTPWNEANHYLQPTAARPALAGRYYAVLKSVCVSCRVLGADVLDQPGLDRWMAGFRRGLRGRSPRLWGLHNYQDGNHHVRAGRSWTLRFPKLVRGQIWATETGGIVRFVTDRGRLTYPYSPTRAAGALRHILDLMHRPEVRARYTRIYVYNWYGVARRERRQRWDSGLVSADGRARPALAVVRRQVRRSRVAERTVVARRAKARATARSQARRAR